MLNDYFDLLVQAYKNDDREAQEDILRTLEKLKMDRNTAILLVFERLKKEK